MSWHKELVPASPKRPSVERATRPKRMRARRLRPQELRVGTVQAQFQHATLGRLSATVEDLSLHGLALVIPGAAVRGALLLTGDRLEEITLAAGTARLYQGRGTARHIDERAGDLVVGVALDTSAVDLGQLYRAGQRSDFAERWQNVKRIAQASDVAAGFKSWVHELRVMLAATEEFLETEERGLCDEDRETAAIARAEYLQVVAPELKAGLEGARKTLAQLVGHLTPEQHAAYRAYCASQLNPYLKQSPFLRRALDKPLGYAGDYEMMNMLYRDPSEGETLLGRALNLCFTDEPAAQANKNRIEYLGAHIRDAVARTPSGRTRIASLGCGPAREIETLLRSSPELGARLDIALIDQEERAIAHCERTLAPLAASTGARVHFIRDSLRALLTRDSLAQKLGQRELIYSAGLFDYLDDRLFRRILGVLYTGLAEGGRLAIGNVAAHNPSRWIMEYFAGWFLIHRSVEALLELGSELPATAQRRVEAEPSGVNLFLHVQR
jgi:extracellular factor (EF) 3-hydroxypalmitic acid methyl ester biosynthesis protein